MNRQERIQKVISAMLSMQRRAWEQGVAAQALLESGETELAILLAKDAVVNQRKDGRLGLNGDKMPVADPAANGEPVLFAARATQDRALHHAAERMRDYLLYQAPRTKTGIIYHNYIENMIWVDAFYMVPPFLAAMGCYEEAVRQVKGYREILLNTTQNVYYHIWDEDKKDFERKLFWGVGNGWAASGMARVIDLLPDTLRTEKKMIAGFVQEVIDGCLRFQRQDSLFHNILDDTTTFVEVNTAQMLSYSIYRGIKGGWLGSEYLHKADLMREAAYKKVDDWGIVQSVCGAPNFDREGTAVEGQAFFLLMESAYDKVCQGNN